MDAGAAVGYITGLHQHAQACNEPPALHQGCWELPNLRRVFAGCKQLTALSGVIPRGAADFPGPAWWDDAGSVTRPFCAGRDIVQWCWGSEK